MGTVETRSEQSIRKIRQLDDAAVHRIAAGEVVERPSSVIKELIENSLDAGATTINVAYADGGKTLIRVADDGHGIPPDQLTLAVRNHATSKIDGSDLVNLHSFGFRGEALAAMGATGLLIVRSRATGSPAAASIVVEGGVAQEAEPAALSSGTVVELTGLFRAIPARLKFLRSDTAEAREIGSTVKRLAMAAPQVAFTLHDVSGGGAGRRRFRADRESGENRTSPARSIEEHHRRGLRGKRLSDRSHNGRVCSPRLCRASNLLQGCSDFAVPVRQRAFGERQALCRHDPCRVFRLVEQRQAPGRGSFPRLRTGPCRCQRSSRQGRSTVSGTQDRAKLIFSGVREVLTSEGRRTSVRVASEFIDSAQPEPRPGLHVLNRGRPSRQAISTGFDMQRPDGLPGARPWPVELDGRPAHSPESGHPVDTAISREDGGGLFEDTPFGSARAQLHSTYIVSETRDGMIIVDQHAAHERLVYERFKAQLSENSINGQPLLIPEIVELDEQDRENILAVADDLAKLRLKVEAFGGSAVCIREVPAILGEFDVSAMIKDICDEISEAGQSPCTQRQDRPIAVGHVVPSVDTRWPATVHCRDERTSSRDGGEPIFRPVQSRQADVCETETYRHRKTFRPTLIQPVFPEHPGAWSFSTFSAALRYRAMQESIQASQV